MTEPELQLLIQQGEGYNVEFKRSIPSKASDLAEEVCAFANAAGGTVIIGVDDKANIIGVAIDNSTRSKLQNIFNTIQPHLDTHCHEVKVNGKNVLCIECPSGKQKPYTVSGSIIIRNGPNSEKITSVDRMREFFQQSDRIFFDEAICKNFIYPDDFDFETFKEFLNKAGVTATLKQEQLLDNLRLINEDGKVINGAVLFFAKEVQNFFEHAIIRCVLFKGYDKRFIVDSQELKGNLIKQFEEAMKYITSKLNLRYEIENQPGGRRKEILEIPQAVFREAIINSLSHRDYYEKGAVTMIEIYDDRVSLTNPGGLVSSIPRNEFGTKSLSRNPLIFGLMQRMDLVEKVGSGINRMKDAMKEAGLLEPVFSMDGFFTVTFYRPVDFDKWISSWAPDLNTSQVKILQLLHDNPKISKKGLSDEVGIGKTAIDNNLTILKKLGMLARVGSDKSGEWQINLIPPTQTKN